MASAALPVVFLVAAATAAELRGAAQTKSTGNAVADQINSAIQGALLLAQAMPHDDGPKPTKAMQDKMDKAAPLVYNAYNVLKNAEDEAEGSVEQMKTGIQKANSASGIATAEALLQRAKAKLKEGSELAQSANSDFMNSADPLSPVQPQPPREWGNVDSMTARARQKASSVERLVNEARSLARQQGVSLITVSSEKVIKIGDEDYAKKAEDKILDFLSSYS
jgi:hypothetical protein